MIFNYGEEELDGELGIARKTHPNSSGENSKSRFWDDETILHGAFGMRKECCTCHECYQRLRINAKVSIGPKFGRPRFNV